MRDCYTCQDLPPDGLFWHIVTEHTWLAIAETLALLFILGTLLALTIMGWASLLGPAT